MTDNVISLGSRRSYHEERAEREIEQEVAVKTAEEAKSTAVANHKETLLRMLDECRALVEKDQLEGLIIVGRQTQTKIFYTDLALDLRLIPAHDFFAYVGCLETLKIELAETAAMAPSLMPDGTTISPSFVMVDENGQEVDL